MGKQLKTTGYFVTELAVILSLSFFPYCNNEHNTNTSAILSLDDNELITQTVLFVYDNPAKEQAITESGSLYAHSKELINEANEIYEKSGIIVRLAISHVEEVDIDIMASIGEMNPHSYLLKYIVPDNDGVLDIIHKWRNMYSADIVVIKADKCGGHAAKIGADENEAFALVGYKGNNDCCNMSLYVFTHEIGHLQGAAHQDSLVKNPVFPYGHANRGENWTTLMYYGDGNKRIPCFSGPGVYYNGIETGDEKLHNNVKAINMTAKKIAGFR